MCLRIGDHLCLKQHFIELAGAVYRELLRIWKMQSPVDEVRICLIDNGIILKRDLLQP